MENKKISVCLATYNGEDFIKKQLVSVLSQLKNDDEVIISDDGSTDSTLDIIYSLKDDRIKVLRHKKDVKLSHKYLSSFYYVSYNFENAIKYATGDVVYLCDQDDVWVKEKISHTLPYFEEYDLLMCNYSIIDATGRVIISKYLKSNPIGCNLLYNLWKIPFKGCCMAITRKALEKALPFPSNCIGHDLWIGLYLMHKGYKCKFVDEPLHLYRNHTSNVSPVIGKSDNGFFFKIWYRLRLLYQIFIHK